MKPTEHVTFAFLLAQLGAHQEYGPAGTLLVVAAGNLPDLDGLTLLAGWKVYRKFHRFLGHGLPMTLAGPALLAVYGSYGLGLEPFGRLWAWLQLSLLAHLLTDVCFYRWPVRLLWPLSQRAWGFGLVSWNDLVPTLILYGATAVVLWRPTLALTAATAGLAAFFLYLAWRAWRPRSRFGWSAWLTGDWARQNARFWRWLTGDFVT
jgi:membrane-bound metal-dependent hydrolase YbcI (DUF457 family)